MDSERKSIRRSVLLLIALSTLAFFGLLFGAAVLRERVPQRRLEKIEAYLAASDTAAARRLIGRVDDEAAAESLLARCDYLDGEAAFARGDWAAARERYAAAGSWEDSADKVRQCDYCLAEDVLASGALEEAEAAFAALGGFSDAADRALDCRYERAAAFESAGELSEAAALFDTLGAYRDAEARVARLALAVTGMSDVAEALSVFRGMSPEAREKMERLAAARESLPQGVVAVGFYHTVGLRADGTVAACGDDSFGQCDTQALHDITAVAAGAYHTLALHRDGTVSALGRNSEGQCDTAAWRDVAAVAAADYASFGLTRDGTLLCTGFYDYAEPESWSGLVFASGGSYNLAALRGDGTVWTYPKLKNTDALRGCVALAVNTGCVTGVMKDGSVACSVFDLSSWEDVIALSESGTAILGLRADGRVLAHFLRPGDAIDFSVLTDVRALAAGGTHFAFVLADGSVRVFGENAHGEAETQDWVLKAG